jgi:hypothetical protein
MLSSAYNSKELVLVSCETVLCTVGSLFNERESLFPEKVVGVVRQLKYRDPKVKRRPVFDEIRINLKRIKM